jgi:lipopolysaccharide transport system ATP-binding protein
MASVQRLCHSGLLLENGTVKFAGSIGDTIATYLTDEIIQSEYINPKPSTTDKLSLIWAKVSPATGSLIYPTTAVDVRLRVRVNADISNLVLGFNLVSSYKHPLARTDYNDHDGRYTLPPGEYDFHFQIPANTLSNGEYTVVFDVAERNEKNYAGEETKLTFRVDIDENSMVNTFSENMDIKSSIIREMWLKGYTAL